MKTFRVNYYFEGKGECLIKATSAISAKKKFYDGDFNEKDDKEWGEDYVVDSTEVQ